MKHVQHIGLFKSSFQWSYQTDQLYGRDVFHSHQGVEIFYFHKGSGTVIREGNQLTLKPGMLLIFQPFQLHYIRFHSEEAAVRSYLVFEPAVIQKALGHFSGLQAYLKKLMSYPLSFPFIVDLAESHPLIAGIQLMHQSTSESSGNPESHLEAGTVTTLAILQWLSQEVPLAGIGKLAVPKAMSHSEKAIEWIEVHLMEDTRIESVAKVLHLNPNYLSTLFQQDIGCSYSEYITTRRISLARKWLIETEWQVKEIADRLGLANVSYFCQLFKKHTGITPYQFKKQMQAAFIID